MNRQTGFKRDDVCYRDSALNPRLDPARHPEFESGRFESEWRSKDRRDVVVNSLEQGGRSERRLALRLYLCDPTSRLGYCFSSACPICGRQFRRLHVGRVLSGFGVKGPDDRAVRRLRALTMIPDWALRRVGDLHTLNLEKASRLIRRRIHRAGLTDFVAAGAWDFSFNTGALEMGEGSSPGFWAPHLHLIVRMPSKSRLAEYKKALKRVLPRRKELGIKMPQKFEKVRDPLGQTSYTYKMLFKRQVALPFSSAGSGYNQFDALPYTIKNELYIYLNTQKERGRSFLIGCARKGRKLVAT